MEIQDLELFTDQCFKNFALFIFSWLRTYRKLKKHSIKSQKRKSRLHLPSSRLICGERHFCSPLFQLLWSLPLNFFVSPFALHKCHCLFLSGEGKYEYGHFQYLYCSRWLPLATYPTMLFLQNCPECDDIKNLYQTARAQSNCRKVIIESITNNDWLCFAQWLLRYY